MKLVFTRRALRDVERHTRWWKEHRDAKTLFEEELAHALRQIRSDPKGAPVYRLVRGQEQRRILMSRTARHVYYRLEGADSVLILAVRGARRRRAPQT